MDSLRKRQHMVGKVVNALKRNNYDCKKVAELHGLPESTVRQINDSIQKKDN